MTSRISMRSARLLVVAAVLAGTAIGAVGAHAQSARPTYGTIPAEAMLPGSALDIAKVPDFISVIGPDGEIAGYVSKADLFDDGPMPGSPGEAAALGKVVGSMPVHDRNGNVVGEWIDERGFVSHG